MILIFFSHVVAYVVDGLDDAEVEVLPLPEEGVECDLADLGPHGRLGELRDGELGVLHAVARLVRVLHSEVEDAVNVQVHIV